MEQQFFRSNGKLMITGEYLVLRGAASLSIPTQRGQTLNISVSEGQDALEWTTTVMGNPWFKGVFGLPHLEINSSENILVAEYLQGILKAAQKLNPQFLNSSGSVSVLSNIEFEPGWGWGSSSSLLVNIATWAGVDPFQLHFMVSQGSGYDIAASSSQDPVIYRLDHGKPRVKKTDFLPAFHEKLFFIYLGDKKSSAQEVKRFSTWTKDYSQEIAEVSSISHALPEIGNFKDFMTLIKRHEEIISGVLGIPPIGQAKFSDMDGVAKSLGAWGGDFIMFATELPVSELEKVLYDKGYKTWFRYSDLILSKNS